MPHDIQSPRPLRNVVILAVGTWLLLAAIVLIGLLLSEESRVPFYFIQLLLAVLGIVGCAGHFLSWRFWRSILLAAGSLYLAFYFLRFFGRFVWWKLEYYSLPLAVWQTLATEWHLAAKQFSDGRWVLGVATLSFEWLLPLLQLAVLGTLMWPLTLRSRGRADKRRAPEL